MFTVLLATIAWPTMTAPPAQAASAPFPMPRGCGTVTPPGEPEPICCLFGLVISDGSAVPDAAVQVHDAQGNVLTVRTTRAEPDTAPPAYRLSLSSAPLRIALGDQVTVTASYNGRSRSLRFTARPGSQQIDLVLPRTQADDYQVEREIWYPGEAGRLSAPIGVAVDAARQVYVIDTTGARVQVFTSEGQFLRQWGRPGRAAGAFAFPVRVAADAVGNIYVSESLSHRVQKFSNRGELLLAWGEYGSAAGSFAFPYGIGVAAEGSIYVADRVNNRVQQFDPQGRWLRSWGGGGGSGQLRDPVGLAVAPDGSVLVADAGNHRIQRFSSTGTWLATWGGPGSGPGQFAFPVGIASDTAGNIYIADTDNHRIQKLSSSGAWLASYGHYGTGLGELAFPEGIAVDAQGSVYVADRDNHRIQRLDPEGGWVAWGGRSRAPGELKYPEGVTVATDGEVLVADTANDRIQRFAVDGAYLRDWGTTGSGPNQLQRPSEVAEAPDGSIYVADTDNHRVQRFSSTGELLGSFGTPGSAPGQFNEAKGVAVDQAGFVYVADRSNHRVQKFTADGIFVSAWGGFGSAPARFNLPDGVEVGPDGSVYVVDRHNHRIQRFSATGSLIGQWGGLGSADGQFNLPGEAAVDQAGFVYVADTDNHRIQKFTADGRWVATWGRLGAADNASATDQSQLLFPNGVAVDSSGRIYIADTGNHRIVVLRPLGVSRPHATIVQLSSDSLGPSDSLDLVGIGQDSDETPDDIVAYRWESDRQGLLGEQAELRLAPGRLAPGSHWISLTVRNSEGEVSTPAQALVYVAEAPTSSWTMLLYLAGDYNDRGALEGAFTRAISALSTNLTNPHVRVAVQIDGPGAIDTRRLLIRPGTPQPLVQSFTYSEQAMDDPAVLTDFIRWGQGSFPAQHYYLVIANHGQAIQGIGWDRTSDPAGRAYLTPGELREALSAPNVAPISLLHLDACSMNLLEVAYELRERVDFLIASQYLSWSYFAYDRYSALLHSDTEPAAAARAIIESYADLARADGLPMTTAALDLRRVTPVVTAVDALAGELAAYLNNVPGRRATLDLIREQTRTFDSDGNLRNDRDDVYIDLIDWAQRVQGTADPAVRQRAAELIAELQQADQPFILASSFASGPLPQRYADGAYIDLSGSNGLSIYYPQRQNTASFVAYRDNQLFAFTAASRWPDYLVAGLSALPPNTPLDPAQGPLLPLSPDPIVCCAVYLPMLIRP